MRTARGYPQAPYPWTPWWCGRSRRRSGGGGGGAPGGEGGSRERAHEKRVDAPPGEPLPRRADGRRHPVADFLFTYYSHRPAQLRRWHPGPGVALAAGEDRGNWRFYRLEGDRAL